MIGFGHDDVLKHSPLHTSFSHKISIKNVMLILFKINVKHAIPHCAMKFNHLSMILAPNFMNHKIALACK